MKLDEYRGKARSRKQEGERKKDMQAQEADRGTKVIKKISDRKNSDERWGDRNSCGKIPGNRSKLWSPGSVGPDQGPHGRSQSRPRWLSPLPGTQEVAALLEM